MIQFEKAKKADFIPVAALDRQAWVHYENAENIPDGEHVWRIWTEHAIIMVAREAQAVVGAIVAFPCISGAWYVHKLFVSPAKQKEGIGKELFNLLLHEIDGLGAPCFLTVSPQNEKLIAFYAALGFTDSEFVSGYYRNNEDRCILKRRGRTDASALTKEIER
jgi:ribosomal protein S18 acetylase RimI-like enzyme